MTKITDVKRRKIGVNFNEVQAEVLVWAPKAKQVRIKIEELALEMDLVAQEFGYWFLQTALLKPGQRYLFELIDENESKDRPDPASLSQPEGVHGPSETVDLNAYPFTDQDWRGIPLEQYLIYELHTGTFTTEGNFLGIEKKLDHLLDLGITAIEIMPVAAFPGNRNWGYDGVYPFAVQASYGGTLALQHLVNICHRKGLSVILDVVYNHFGPEGNYFEDFAPYFTEKYQTPWGKAINFDDAYANGVRSFFIENVLMWFRDFHIDALRLDAIHAIKDLGAKHILAEIKEEVELLNAQSGKNHYLLVECDLNDHKIINPLAKEGYGMDAQWIDEFHHALRVAAGQKKEGYYADFNGIEHLAKSYEHAYVYDGIFSPQRQKIFGNKVQENPGQQFIIFSQNHDQVGNRMLGERTSQLLSFEMQKLLLGAVLVAPYLPLLFMGEEWGETNPFLYFVDHGEAKLIEAVRKGRNDEFKAFHADGTAPDPQDAATFNKSKLQWDLLQRAPHQQLLTYYKTIIALRKTNKVLKNLDRKQIKSYPFKSENCLIIHRWHEEEEVLCCLNFSATAQLIRLPFVQKWHQIFNSAEFSVGKPKSQPQISADGTLKLQSESILIFSTSYAAS